MDLDPRKTCKKTFSNSRQKMPINFTFNYILWLFNIFSPFQCQAIFSWAVPHHGVCTIVFYGASSNSITPDWFFPPNWAFLQKAPCTSRLKLLSELSWGIGFSLHDQKFFWGWVGSRLSIRIHPTGDWTNVVLLHYRVVNLFKKFFFYQMYFLEEIEGKFYTWK